MKVYHLSHKKNRESIKKIGLLPLAKAYGTIIYGPRVFVSKDMKNLAFDYVGYSNVDVWSFEVDEKMLEKDEFSSNDAHFFITHKIDKKSIKLTKEL